MSGRSRLASPAVAFLTSAAAGIAAAAGVFLRGDGSTTTVTSIRGETLDVAMTGVYAWNAQRVVAEGVGWDVFTLVVAAPAMLVAGVLLARGSFRGRLLTGGLYGYFLYLYLEYAVTWAFGPLFLAYIGTFVLALIGLGLVAADVARDGIAGRFDAGYPARGWPVALLAMSGLLTMLWLKRIAEGLTTGVDGVLFGETTMTVQALDLALVVPICVAVAVSVWRRTDLGLVAGAAWGVTFTAMAAAILSMMLSAWAVEGSPEPAPIVIFGTATLAGLWLSVRTFRAVRPDTASASIPAPAAVPAPA